MSAPDDPSVEVGPAREPHIRSLIGLLVLLGGFRLLFPGDIRFVNDEPLLFQHALDMNEAGRVASAGLTGTRGIAYGPVPTWFYQAALALTADPVLVAGARILLVTAMTGLALTMLARSLGGIAYLLGAFAFLSPYLWMYARDLWDNSFSIPFSAMLLATYAQFLRVGRLRWLTLAVVFGTLCFLTHPMTLPLVGAIAVHAAATRWRAVVSSRRLALGLAAALCLCLVPILVYIGGQSGRPVAGFALSPHPERILFALNGARLFSPLGFDYFIGPWRAGGFVWLGGLVSLLAYAAGAWGLVLSVKAVQRADPLRKDIASVLLLTLAFFVVLANGMGLTEHPHYYNGVWIVFFCFWWMGMSDLVRHAWARRLLGAQVAVMAVFLVGIATWVHANRGTKTLHYGATLENQMAIARELDRLGAGDAPESAAVAPRLFPHSIAVLRRLERKAAAEAIAPNGPSADVRIVYADPEGASGELTVEVAPPR